MNPQETSTIQAKRDPTELRVLAFDVFGTVVDWFGSVRSEVARRNLGVDADAFAGLLVIFWFLCALVWDARGVGWLRDARARVRNKRL